MAIGCTMSGGELKVPPGDMVWVAFAWTVQRPVHSSAIFVYLLSLYTEHTGIPFSP